MLFNKSNKNSINKYNWKFEYEDTIYKVYDQNNNLAGYFFPNYHSIKQKKANNDNDNDENHQEEDEIIEKINKLHGNVRGGNLMIPMLRLNLLDHEEEKKMDVSYTIEELEGNLYRAKQWKQWVDQNSTEFKVVGNAVYTAREDRNMLSVDLGISSDVILGEKEIGVALTPLLDKLHEDGML
jgi:hypothetical protein